MHENIDKNVWKPIAVPFEELSKYQKAPGVMIVDQYQKNLEELFLLRNPKYRFDKEYKGEFELFFNENKDRVNWFYFPWRKTVAAFLPEEMHQELRTGRNRNLITKEEQDRFYNSTIGILGMSVGSHVAIVIAMTGGAKHIKIADPDTLSGDNLNRIRGSFLDVGTKKAVLVARQIAEINPYAEIDVYEEGLADENIVQFLNELDLLVEEMDNPYFKIKIRYLCRDKKIPVIMAADNGDGVIVDVERYDMDKNPKILHGLVKNLDPEKLKNLSAEELPKVIAKIAGANLAVPRMLDSVTEVGKSLYSWPQLGTAANLCGSALAYLARRIILKAPNIKSGRYQVNLDSIFESGYKRKWFSRKIAFFKFIRNMKQNS